MMSASDRRFPASLHRLRVLGPTRLKRVSPNRGPGRKGRDGSVSAWFPARSTSPSCDAWALPLQDGADLRHRPAPPSGLPALGRHGPRGRSGGRLNRIIHEADPIRRRSHAGHRLPPLLTARYGQIREAFPPAWLEAFAIHPGGGSAGKYGTGVKGVEKIGGFLWDGAARTLSPLVGENVNFSALALAKCWKFQERGSVSEQETPPHLKNLRLGVVAPRP